VVEGERAFNRAGRMVASPDLTDLYLSRKPSVRKHLPACVSPGWVNARRIRQLLTSPLKDDFALIKIEKIPSGLVPIPLDLDMDPRRLPNSVGYSPWDFRWVVERRQTRSMSALCAGTFAALSKTCSRSTPLFTGKQWRTCH